MKIVIKWLAVSSLLVTVIYFALLKLPSIEFVSRIENLTYDLRMQLADFKPTDNITVIAYDKASLKANLRKYNTPEFPEFSTIDVINYLQKADAKLIVFDTIFVESEYRTQSEETALINAYKKYNNLIIGMHFDNEVNKDTREGMINGLSQDIFYNNHLEVFKSALFTESPLAEVNTYRSFEPLLLPFYNKDHIGIVNRSASSGDILRALPLIFTFQTRSPIISDALPSRLDKKTGKYFDRKKQETNSDGFLLDQQGYLIPVWRKELYPGLPLRAFMALKELEDKQEPDMRFLSPDRFELDRMSIPFNQNGDVYLSFYNHDGVSEYYKFVLNGIEEEIEALKQDTAMPEQIKKVNIQALQEKLRSEKETLATTEVSRPYLEISVSTLLDDALRVKNGARPNQEIVSQVKDKVVFIGFTDLLAEGYHDTPLGKMYDVQVHATLFDNLQQRNGFIRKANTLLNNIVLTLVLLVVAGLIFRSKSLWISTLVSIAISLVYCGIAVYVFSFHKIWIDLVIPVGGIGLITVLVLTFKYFILGKAYQGEWKNANTDSMTGLYNYRFFKNHINTLIKKSENMDQQFSLILIDIDFFKKFNDTYGHQAGDEVLRQVAQKLKDVTRSTDKVIRYGGEEMCILLETIRDADVDGRAVEIAKQVVRKIAEGSYEIAAGTSVSITISAGVATYPLHGDSLEELVEFADEGLYAAKENGRNQVGIQKQRLISSEAMDVNSKLSLQDLKPDKQESTLNQTDATPLEQPEITNVNTAPNKTEPTTKDLVALLKEQSASPTSKSTWESPSEKDEPLKEDTAEDSKKEATNSTTEKTGQRKYDPFRDNKFGR